MFLHRYKAIINLVLAATAVVGLFGPGDTTPSKSLDFLSQLWQGIFHATNVYIFAAERPFLALLAIGFFYTAIVSIRYRNVPITVISTEMEMRYLKSDGSVVETVTTQTIRSNYPNVTAYYMVVGPTNGGSLNEKDVEIWLTTPIFPIKESSHLTGDEKTRWECIHYFDPALPYAWYLPLIPESLLLRNPEMLPRFLRKYIVTRHTRFTFKDEYTVETPYLQLQSLRYTHKRISVELHFPKGGMPKAGSVLAQRILSNGVFEVNVQKLQKSGRTYYKVAVDKMANERLRVSWTNGSPTKMVSSRQKSSTSGRKGSKSRQTRARVLKPRSVAPKSV